MKTIEEIALEEHADMTKVYKQYDVVKFLSRCLARIDADRGKESVAWVEVADRHEGPYNFHGKELLDSGKHSLFLSPTIPEGMVMVDKKLLSTTIKLTKEASETEFNRQPLSDELYGVSLMLAAAQGERNAD